MRLNVLVGADDDVGTWIFARTRAQWVPGQGAAIGFTCGESLVAGVAYTMYNGANVWAAIAVDPAFQRRWATRQALRVIFDYPFRQLGCQRISALVYETNTVSQRFLTRLGFHREATLAQAAPDGDMFVYALHEKDCQWLR